MSPRPRTLPDSEILDAAARVIGRTGPARLTLADVAREVGLSPSTLVQRFGSKHGLFVAFAEHAGSATAEVFAAARAAHPSPREALIAALAALASPVGTPETFANHFALLQLDLADPELRERTAAHARALRAQIRTRVQEAMDAGEVAAGDAARTARLVHATYNGSLLAWGIEREGALEAWLRADLEALLGE